MRFIHGADLHMDRNFEGLTGIDEKVAEDLMGLNEQVLTNIVEVALAEAVDFLILAGDTFHQQRPSLRTQHHFMAAMARLQAAGIPVYLSFGNHDHFDEQRYWFDFPENVHCFFDEEVTTFLAETAAGETYAVSGFSYTTPYLTASKVASFPGRASVDFHVGIYHGDRQARQFAPFSVEEMRQKGYDYWALGHIHVPEILSRDPWIVYPGTPQGHSRKETQVKGVLLVTAQPGGITVAELPVATVAWRKETLSLAASDTKAGLRILQEYLQSSTELPVLLALHLTDTGHLGKDFYQGVVSGELLQFLNQERSQQHLIKLTMDTPQTDRLNLPVSADLMGQLRQEFTSPEILTDIWQEAAGEPQLRKFLQDHEFQEQALLAMDQLIQEDFTWGGDPH